MCGYIAKQQRSALQGLTSFQGVGNGSVGVVGPGGGIHGGAGGIYIPGHGLPINHDASSRKILGPKGLASARALAVDVQPLENTLTPLFKQMAYGHLGFDQGIPRASAAVNHFMHGASGNVVRKRLSRLAPAVVGAPYQPNLAPMPEARLIFRIVSIAKPQDHSAPLIAAYAFPFGHMNRQPNAHAHTAGPHMLPPRPSMDMSAF